MLGKLMKYEFKSTGRMFGVILLVILILSLMIGLLGRTLPDHVRYDMEP